MATPSTANASVGTIKVVIGDVKVIGVDGVARQVHVGDKVFAKETIQTAANAVVQVQLENGRTLDLGRDSKIALDDDVLNVGQTATTAPPATGDIAALQAQIAAGADPSKWLKPPQQVVHPARVALLMAVAAPQWLLIRPTP